jgi:nucleoside-diphosphate-sugar epimerase
MIAQAYAGKTILVTGGAGAIGANLVRALLDLAPRGVVVLDNLSSGRRSDLPRVERLALFVGDVVDDEMLHLVFSRHRPDLVFHLAANFANQNSVDHPRRDLTTNGLGTLKLLEYAQRAGVERFVYTSSSCVYGGLQAAAAEETTDFNLDTPYAITKLLGERYVNFFHHHHRLPTVILRYFNAYGPGERPGPYRNVIPNFLARAAAGQPLVITGTGQETRDFTFVADSVALTLRAAAVPQALGRVYNVGSGRETAILDLAERINALVGNPAGIEFVPRRGWDHIPRRLADVGRARAELDYEPRVGLDEGLALTWAWLKSRLD